MSAGPAADLPGVDAGWSRLVTAPDADGRTRTWHLLDNQIEPSNGTLLCVHGNPTWSYLWRRFLAGAAPGWRVVAVDQLGMGFSERTRPRRLADRISDLGLLTDTLGLDGPVVTLAHDWGGPVSLGWALAHRDRLAGLVLANTGVHLPAGGLPPGLIRLARLPVLRHTVCVRTPVFLHGASALSRPRLPAETRRGLELPYAVAARRAAIGDFVADIPVEANHPSRAVLDDLAARLPELADVPALLLWGPLDPVFTEAQLADLLRRLPQADVQRYPRASHLVTEDAPESAEHVWQWLTALPARPVAPRRAAMAEPAEMAAPVEPRLPWSALVERGDDPAPAVVELHRGRTRTTSFAELETRVADLAGGLSAVGVQAGQRVALLVPPGVDLTVAVYACWRLGAVIVVADAGLGLRGLGHALRSAQPDHVIAIRKGLFALGPLRVPGRRIPASRLPQLEARGRGIVLPPRPGGDPEAAVLFTSGATGPAKGVVYRLSQLTAQIDQVGAAMGLTRDDRLVAAFAPFALYGPALGIGAAVPDMTVTAPGTLTAQALADAVQAVDATVVFASPAALRNVVATADEMSPSQRAALGRLRRLMSAGAPVPVALLGQVQQLLPAAELHTPYGMTEALPVADISLPQIEAAGSGDGVCVGRPLPGVSVQVSPLDPDGRADGALTDQAGVTGEICVAAAHIKDHYDRLWATERLSSRNPGWHRTGDAGHLDEQGRLWVEGRLVHVLTTPAGPLTPVGIEQRVESVAGVAAAAVVGVGPAGTQQAVAVVVPDKPLSPRPSRLASAELAAAVRAAAQVPVAAVLVIDRLPVDIRHASKVDRARVASWAGHILSGGRPSRWAAGRR